MMMIIAAHSASVSPPPLSLLRTTSTSFTPAAGSGSKARAYSLTPLLVALSGHVLLVLVPLGPFRVRDRDALPRRDPAEATEQLVRSATQTEQPRTLKAQA